MPDPVPARLWTEPNTFVLGYLEFGEPTTRGDVTEYAMTFRASTLDEPPRVDVRFDPPPNLTAPMLVSVAERIHQDQLRARSRDLAIERGHLRKD